MTSRFHYYRSPETEPVLRVKTRQIIFGAADRLLEIAGYSQGFVDAATMGLGGSALMGFNDDELICFRVARTKPAVRLGGNTGPVYSFFYSRSDKKRLDIVRFDSFGTPLSQIGGSGLLLDLLSLEHSALQTLGRTDISAKL